MSKNSKIKKWFKNKTKVFEVISLTPSSAPPHESEDAIKPVTKIKFLKNIKSNVRITVSTVAFNSLYIEKFTSELSIKEDFQKGDERTYELATLYKQANKNSVWNCSDNRGNIHLFEKHSQSIAEIKIGKQRYKVYIKHFDPQSKEKGVCYLLGEDTKIWEKGNG